jgi:hypothetical protein
MSRAYHRIPSSLVAIVPGLLPLLAVVVVVVLANPPEPDVLLFTGGWRGCLFGLAMMALVPLIIILQFSLGAGLAGLFEARGTPQIPWLLWLSGSAILSLVGVALAVISAINPWVCGFLFVLGIAFAVGPGRRVLAQASRPIGIWLRLADIQSHRVAFGGVRIGIVIAILMIGLRAAVGELNDTDVVQFYWGWLNEVRYLHGIWLSPERPLIQDFVVGRGNGTYLFFVGFSPGLVVHAVSASYSILFSIMLRAFVLRATAVSSSHAQALPTFAADLALFAGLWMLPGAVAFGKYHLQFAAWGLGLLLASLVVVRSDWASARSYRISLVPLALAIPIALPQYEAFALLVIVLAMIASQDFSHARRLGLLAILSLAATAISLFANWLYLGIPELNPFPLFEHFIADHRFNVWSSRLQQYDINYIVGGVVTFSGGGRSAAVLGLRTLANELLSNLKPLLAEMTAIIVVACLAWIARSYRLLASWSELFLGVALAGILFEVSLALSFSELATGPLLNHLIGLAAGGVVCCWILIRQRNVPLDVRFAFALLGYFAICNLFVVLFQSGNLNRLMRHADTVAVCLLVISLVYCGLKSSRLASWSASIVALLIGCVVLFSFRAAVVAAAVDPPWRLALSAFGVQGRAVKLTNPLVNFDRCHEIAASVPEHARAMFLNAYSAMASCNNAAMLPRTMMVHQYESDYARDIAQTSFADADTVERVLHALKIDYFIVLKGDSEFWTSGFSAPFRPGELEKRFELVADTPSFYVLTWRAGKGMSQNVVADITEWRRVGIQQHGFMLNNEFVGQWRAMANLGADRPKYQMGSSIDFTARGWSALYADHGWYAPEAEGSWTLGPRAVLTLPFSRPISGALDLQIELTPFLVPQIPERNVRLLVNGREVASWKFRLGDARGVRRVELPADLVKGEAQLVLTFEISDSRSPYELNISPDWRPVGIMVRSLRIDEGTAG